MCAAAAAVNDDGYVQSKEHDLAVIIIVNTTCYVVRALVVRSEYRIQCPESPRFICSTATCCIAAENDDGYAATGNDAFIIYYH